MVKQIERLMLAIVLVVSMAPTLAFAESTRSVDSVADRDASGLAVESTVEVPEADVSDNAGEQLTLSADSATVSAGWTQFGTCEWRIDGNGTLTIRPLGNGSSGQLSVPEWKTEEVNSPDIGTYTTSTLAWPWRDDSIKSSVKKMVVQGHVKSDYSLHQFCRGLSNLESADLSGIDDASELEYMSSMFKGCEKLTQVKLFKGTKNVTDMSELFHSCSSLKSVDLSGLDTLNVTSISNMFTKCSSLTSANLSNFDTKNVEDMSALFHSCTNLQSVNISSFNTSNVTNMAGMFYGCETLRSVSLSNFSTSKVTTFGWMFYDCPSLSELNLSTFDTSSVTYMEGMFNGPNNLQKITLGKRFKFIASGSSQYPWFPSNGNGDGWMSSADGVVYDNDAIPSNVAATYTYVPSGTSTNAMFRMYNPNSGEHFYTASVSERDNLVKVGWNYEGIGWNAPKTSKTPVYRLYSGTDHHYTTSASERDSLVKVGWKYEGIGWYSDDAKGVPLYRQFNPNVNPKAKYNNSGSHNYTTSKAENDQLVKLGWRAEGIGWYGVK